MLDVNGASKIERRTRLGVTSKRFKNRTGDHGSPVFLHFVAILYDISLQGSRHSLTITSRVRNILLVVFVFLASGPKDILVGLQGSRHSTKLIVLTRFAYGSDSVSFDLMKTCQGDMNIIFIHDIHTSYPYTRHRYTCTHPLDCLPPFWTEGTSLPTTPGSH